MTEPVGALRPQHLSHSASMDRIRSFFAYVPRGAKYNLSTFDTTAIGAPAELVKQMTDAIARELRAGAKDPRVTNVTVLIMYDGPLDGEGRTPPRQLLLQPLPMEARRDEVPT